MRKTLSLVTALCLYIGAFAQPATQIIKGIIIDSAKNQPMGFVTVSLQHLKTRLPAKSMLSKDNGSFEFEVPRKPYQLALASVGFRNKLIAIDSTKKVVDLGRILMQPSSKDLKEVSVVALKPVVKQEVDRISYDVQADPDSKVINVLDMLRKTPLITVDATDQIRMKGNTDFKILINNKPSALIAHNPSDVFKAMPAANIERIEVITTPPAKYDAEGIAGIINIITKKNTDQGYNGTVSARYNNVYGPGVSLNGTVKQGKFGIVGYVGYNKQKQNNYFSDRSQTFLQTQSVLNQNSSNYSKGHSNYGSAELSYEIDSLDLLSGEFNVFTGKYNNGGTQFSEQVNAADIITQSFRTLNSSFDNWQGLDASLNFQRGFKRNKQQLLTFSYKYSYSPDKSFTNLDIENIVDYDFPGYQQYNTSGNKEHTIQSDYTQPFKKVTMEAGFKAILRKNYSDFHNDVFNEDEGLYITDPTQTNDFDYQQNVYSLYNSYQLKLSKWSAKAGLRLEHTTVDANFITAGSTANQDYNNFIPSFSVQRMLKGSSVSFGFTDRISRPGIWQLNPFVNKTNPKYYTTGNPNLRPVVNHSFNANYSKFGKININGGLNFNFANNTIQNLNTLQGDTLTITSYQNIGKSRSLGGNLNVSTTIKTKLSVSLSMYATYIKLTGSYNNLMYSNDGIQGNTFLNLSYKTGTWRFGANAYGYTPFIMLQGKSNPYFSSSYSVSKDVLNKKMTISLSANNPYQRYINTTSHGDSPDYTQISHNRSYYSSYNLSLNYKFGRLNSSIKKNQRGINNDDSSGSGKSSN